jgi:DNA-binding MarR family transcriptional regulator
MNETCSGDPCPGIHRILAAARSLEARVEASLARLDLSLAKVGVLRHLAHAGSPLALSVLAERHCCVKSNMTQLVDRLQADGLVERMSDAQDRRSVLASITAEGRRRYEQAAAVLTEQEGLLQRRLSEEASEASDLRQLLGSP